MESRDGLPVVEAPSAQEWDAWLRAAGPESPGAWLRIARAGAAGPSASYAEALECALRHGWIDGTKAALDAGHWLQRFTPRRARSRWSRRNRETAERLIDEGRMEPAGLAQVEAARADGRWERAYHGMAGAPVPDDLRAALDAAPGAAAAFAVLDGANRYAILFRVEEARRPDTRARRIAGFVEMLARGDRPHG